jgi:hypothetical protein
MITDNKRDELIFDFLEGNLSAEEEEAFRILKDESELFNREVRLWQNTYLEEPLPAVDVLEKKLLIHSGWDMRSLWSRMYSVLLILFVFVMIPADRMNEGSADSFVAKTVKVPSSVRGIEKSEVVAPNVEEMHPKVIGIGKRVSQTTDTRHEVTSTVRLRDLNLKSLADLPKPGMQKIEIKKTIIVPVVTRKKWTKREKKLIRQKRWHDNNTRQANKFQKGRVPYVVPLNSSNF